MPQAPPSTVVVDGHTDTPSAPTSPASTRAGSSAGDLRLPALVTQPPPAGDLPTLPTAADLGRKPTFFERLPEITTDALTFAGGLLGPQFAGPGLLAKMTGAGLGAGTLHVAGRTAQAAGHAAFPSRVAPPPTLPDLATETGDVALQYGSGEALGAGLTNVWQGAKNLAVKTPLGAPFAKKVLPVAQMAAERGITMTPAQARGSRWLQVLENVMGSSLTGGPKYAQMLQQSADEFGASVKSELAQFGPGRTTESAGLRIQAGLRAAERAEKDAANTIYDQEVWPLAEQLGTQVSLTPVRTFSEQELAKRGLAADVEGGGGIRFLKQLTADTPTDTATGVAQHKIAEHAAGQLGTTTTDLLNNPKYADVLHAVYEQAGIPPDLMAETSIPFRAAHHLRSAAGDLTRSPDPKVAGLAKQIYARLDESMEQSAASTPELQSAYTRATSAWKDLRRKYTDSVAQAVMETEPRLAVDTLIKPRRVRDVRELRESVSPRAWQALQRNFAEKVLEDPSKITDTLNKYGAETIAEIFPPRSTQVGGANGLYQLGRIADHLGAKGTGTGKIWIELTQAGAASGLVLGRQPGKAAMVLLAPPVLAHIMSKPATRQWLTTGLKATAAGETGLAARMTGQLLSALIRDKVLTPDGKTPPPPQTQGAGPLGSVGLGGRAGGPPPIEALRGRGAPPPPTPPPPPPR